MDFHKIKKLMKEKFKEDPDFAYGFPTLAQSYNIENHKWWTKNFSEFNLRGLATFFVFWSLLMNFRKLIVICIVQQKSFKLKTIGRNMFQLGH